MNVLLEWLRENWEGTTFVTFATVLLAWVSRWDKKNVDNRTLEDRYSEQLAKHKLELEVMLLTSNKETLERLNGEIREVRERYGGVQKDLDSCHRDRLADREDATRKSAELELRIAQLMSELIKVARQLPPSSGQEAVILKLDSAALVRAENAKSAAEAAKEIHESVNSPFIAMMKRELAGKKRELVMMERQGGEDAASMEAIQATREDIRVLTEELGARVAGEKAGPKTGLAEAVEPTPVIVTNTVITKPEGSDGNAG